MTTETLGVCIHGVRKNPWPGSDCEACDSWRWWEPGHPIWEGRPHVYSGGTRMIWWDEPWRLMHWSTRIAASLVVSLILSVVGFIGYMIWWSHENPEPPPPCSTYSDWRASEVPARCISYFEDGYGVR